nr:hypothetical protein [Candidatus Njordarchaeum guaymaensis]
MVLEVDLNEGLATCEQPLSRICLATEGLSTNNERVVSSKGFMIILEALTGSFPSGPLLPIHAIKIIVASKIIKKPCIASFTTPSSETYHKGDF